MVHEEAPEVESGEGVTHRLCSWVNGLTLEEIPENIKTRAKYLMLDGFGCAIVGAHLPWTEKAVNIVLDMEAAGDCLVWGYDKVSIGIQIGKENSLLTLVYLEAWTIISSPSQQHRSAVI